MARLWQHLKFSDYLGGFGRAEPLEDLQRLPQQVRSLVGAAAAAVIAAEYPPTGYSSPSVALGAVGTDAILACPALTAEESLPRYVPVYTYEFNDENAPI